MRSGKFDPESLFLSVLHLATATNREGYDFSLQRTWAAQDKNPFTTPVKSSLSEARAKVSYEFFKEAFEEDLKRLNRTRRTHRGYYVYAVDGTDLDLPASVDVIRQGYRGQAWNKELETYYPKMYAVHAYDVVNEVVYDFRFANAAYELRMALDMIGNFEKNSVAIYDRLYCGYPLIEAHEKAGNYFLARAKNSGVTTAKPIKAFLESHLREVDVMWDRRARDGSDAKPGIKVRLLKIWNPRTREDAVFVTNLPKEAFTRKEMGVLYQRRWDVETSFRDLMNTFKMGQWHSTKVNGILQEIYTLLWFANAVKAQMNQLKPNANDFLAKNYSKSKFKMCAILVLQNINLLIRRKIGLLIDLLDMWIWRTVEKRVRMKRQYPRVTHVAAQMYPLANKVRRRTKLA